MIRQLYIKNFTLIDELNIKFYPGFSVITGETGAGKSIIIGAIGLLLGNRADIRQIRNGKEKCVIEAHFDISNYAMDCFFENNDIDYDASDCILRREISGNGKSRAFVNDTPVSLSVMRELGETLIDIHSQHQNLLLQKDDFQLNVIDVIACDKELVADYCETFNEYKQVEKQLQQLYNDIAKAKENEDFIRFQYQEIEDSHLQGINQEELEIESKTLAHAEEIKAVLVDSGNKLSEEDNNNILECLRHILQNLQSVSSVYPPVEELLARVDSAYIELKDVASELTSEASDFEFDPERQNAINAKLDRIYTLEQKYHVSTIKELFEIQERLKQQLYNIDYSGEEVIRLENKKQQLFNCALEKAAALTALRKKTAAKVEKEMQLRLAPLGMPNVRFKVLLQEKPLASNGMDKIQFLFSANNSSVPRPVSEIASGGEIARVMLSLKALISGAIKLPTIIFDEIDTGVSGHIAEKMAQIMREMGEHNRQVISITHLPQIAAMGTAHYKVSKRETSQGTNTNMHELSGEERITEIAQMLSGSNITPAAIENAKSLLGI